MWNKMGMYINSFISVVEMNDWYVRYITRLKSCACIKHYNDVIMGTMASKITSVTIVYSIVYSGADQRKHQSSASLAFVRGIHRGPVNSPHNGPVMRKKFPFDGVIMIPPLKDITICHWSSMTLTDEQLYQIVIRWLNKTPHVPRWRENVLTHQFWISCVFVYNLRIFVWKDIETDLSMHIVIIT